MEKRPTSVTAIAWITIISGLIGFYGVLMQPRNPVAARLIAQSPLPMSVHMAFGGIGAIVTLVAGYGMLKGYPWSRWLYVGWGIVALIFSLVTVPIISILAVSLLFILVIAFFLFRPAANAWFRRAASE
jgi:phosphoglycerol transferase MdoB-like AlkP superfamily enzyme